MPTNLLHISYKHFDIFTFQHETPKLHGEPNVQTYVPLINVKAKMLYCEHDRIFLTSFDDMDGICQEYSLPHWT